MTTKTIDHNMLTHLVESGSVQAASVIGQAGGWVLSVKYGVAERFLAAQRSGKLRLFRKLETLIAYLSKLGITDLSVNTANYNASTNQRPDRSKALKLTHEAAEYDAWFRSQVQEAIDELDDPNVVLIPHEVVMANLKGQLDKIAAKAKGN